MVGFLHQKKTLKTTTPILKDMLILEMSFLMLVHKKIELKLKTSGVKQVGLLLSLNILLLQLYLKLQALELR